MNITEILNGHEDECENWFERHPFVFQSEVEAIRGELPEGEQLFGIEVGLGTGRYAEALGIREGVESSVNMRKRAVDRGIEIMNGPPEQLPYGDMRFDFVVMVFSLLNIKNLHAALKEAHRVLKADGSLIVGFIDRESIIGKQYESNKYGSARYKPAAFYRVDKVINELVRTGFRNLTIKQTLFGPLDEIITIQHALAGYGEGSFIVIKAMKKS